MASTLTCRHHIVALADALGGAFTFALLATSQARGRLQQVEPENHAGTQR